MTMDQAYSWDEEVIENPQEQGEFVLLEPGDYEFEVTQMQRDRFEGSDKMSACNMAIVTIAVKNPDMQEYDVRIPVRLFLNKKVEGILCAFFTCIGLRQSGEPLVLAWSKIVGCRGHCRITHRKYNDNTYNNVSRWLAPDEEIKPAPKPAPKPAAQQASFNDDDDEAPF